MERYDRRITGEGGGVPGDLLPHVVSVGFAAPLLVGSFTSLRKVNFIILIEREILD